MSTTSRRGMSLIETLIVCLLLSALLLVLGEFVHWGLRAHRKGEAARKATTMGRDMVSHLVSAIATGVKLQPFNPDALNGIRTDFQSAVLWPDPYQGGVVTFGDPFYLRESLNTTLPSGQLVPVDRVRNRVIFTRPGTAPGPNFNTNDYSQFVYVEYVVAPADANGRGQNILYRRLYQCAPGPNQNPVGVSLLGSQRTIDPSFFVMDPTSPLGNVNMLNAGVTPEERLEQCVIFQLPHLDDQITFTVDHTQYVSPDGQQPPRAPAYDPSLFTVTMNVSVDRVGDGYLSSGRTFMATQVYSLQGRVKTGE